MLVRPSAMAIGISIDVGDRPYYEGPVYWDDGATNGYGYPGVGANTIDGSTAIMSAVANGIASMPGSIITTATTITIVTRAQS